MQALRSLSIRTKLMLMMLSLLLLSVGASAVRAQYSQPGLNLAWEHCYADGGTAM